MVKRKVKGIVAIGASLGQFEEAIVSGSLKAAPRCAKHPKDPCWICEKPPVKYAVSHHVMGAKVDPDLTVDLCRGCHMLEKYLSQRKFLDNAAAVGRLITLARFHAGLPDARTFVYYEDEESQAKMEQAIAKYLTAHTEVYDVQNVAHKIYEVVYPHTKK